MSTMYTLTAMTGKEASASRTVVIGTIEFNWRVWMILVWTSPVALLATLVAWPFLSQIALVMFPIIEGLAIFLIHRRTSQGLRLRTYQALWDKKKADINSFILCARKIQVTETDYRLLMSNTVSYVPTPPPPSDALLDHLLDKPVPPGVVPVAHRDLPRPFIDDVSVEAERFPRPQVSAPTAPHAVSRHEWPAPVPGRSTSSTRQPVAPSAMRVEEPRHVSRLDDSLIGIEDDSEVIDASRWLDNDEAPVGHVIRSTRGTEGS